MARFFLVLFVLLSPSSGYHLHKSDEPREDSSYREVVDFTVHISEGGEEYNEKIEVDPDKQTELFQVPAHPGVDRSDTLHDFKQNLTMLRFPDINMCFIFPLMNEQSTPEELMRDLKKAKEMVITETRRVDTSWIIDSEVTDRSVLTDELADFCEQYSIYHVTEAHEALEVTGMETEERADRLRRQTVSGLNNGTALCPGGMDLDAASQLCFEPKLDCQTSLSCSKSVKCSSRRRRSYWGPWGFFGWGGYFHHRPRRSNCWNEHTTRLVTLCCKYICENIGSGNGNNGTTEIFERRL